MAQERERGITIVVLLLLVSGKIIKSILLILQDILTLRLKLKDHLRVLMVRWLSLMAKWVLNLNLKLFGGKPINIMCLEFVLLIRLTKLVVISISHLISIHHRLSKQAFPIHLPIGFEQSINGVVDLVNMKAYTYKEFTDHELSRR